LRPGRPEPVPEIPEGLDQAVTLGVEVHTTCDETLTPGVKAGNF